MSETKTITIAGEQFTISAPYAEGHTCSAAEAKALNQVRAENIANNKRAEVKSAVDGGEGAPTLDQVRESVAAYDREYVFTLASVGGARKSVDPVEREARKIAMDILKSKYAEKGVKIADVKKSEEGQAKIDAALEQLMAHEQVVALAKKKVKEQDKLREAISNIET